MKLLRTSVFATATSARGAATATMAGLISRAGCVHAKAPLSAKTCGKACGRVVSGLGEVGCSVQNQKTYFEQTLAASPTQAFGGVCSPSTSLIRTRPGPVHRPADQSRCDLHSYPRRLISPHPSVTQRPLLPHEHLSREAVFVGSGHARRNSSKCRESLGKDP